MSATTDQILEQLKSLTLLEASELVKQIEEAFGVSAAAPVGVAMVASGAAAPVEEVEEKPNLMSSWTNSLLIRKLPF